jgi:hypothetical protein
MSDRYNRIRGYRASLGLQYNVACLSGLVAFQRSVNPRSVPGMPGYAIQWCFRICTSETDLR